MRTIDDFKSFLISNYPSLHVTDKRIKEIVNDANVQGLSFQTLVYKMLEGARQRKFTTSELKLVTFLRANFSCHESPDTTDEEKHWLVYKILEDFKGAIPYTSTGLYEIVDNYCNGLYYCDTTSNDTL